MVSQQFSQMRSVVIKLTFGMAINVAISCVNEVDAQQAHFRNHNSNRSRSRNSVPQWQQQYGREIYSSTNSHSDRYQHLHQSQPQSHSQSVSRWGPQDRPHSHSHSRRQSPQKSFRGRGDFGPLPFYSSGSDSEQTYDPQSSTNSAPSSGANYWGQQDERERHRRRGSIRGGSRPLTSSSTSTSQPPQLDYDVEPPARTLGDFKKQRQHWRNTFPYGRQHDQGSRWGETFPQHKRTSRGDVIKNQPKGFPFRGPGKYNDFIVKHWMNEVLPVFEEETRRRNLDKEEQYLLYRFLREVVYQYNLGDSDRREYMHPNRLTSEEYAKEIKERGNASRSSKSKKNSHKHRHYWGLIIEDQAERVNLKELERVRAYPSYFQEFLVEKILRNHGFVTQNVHGSSVDFRILGMENNEENPSKKDHSQAGSLFANLQGNLPTPWQVEVKSSITQQLKIKCGGADNKQALNLCKPRTGMQKRIERTFLQQVAKCEKKVRFYDQQHVDVRGVGSKNNSVFHFGNQNEKQKQEQNPKYYAEFSYPDKETMPSLPKILRILEIIVAKLGILTYYPKLTWREMQQEFPYYMDVSKTTQDYTKIEQQYFRTLYGDISSRRGQLWQKGITKLKTQLERLTPTTSGRIFDTKEKKGLEWLVDGVVDQHKQQRGIPRGVGQPQARGQPVEEKRDDEQTQDIPKIIQSEEVRNGNPPSQTETNSSDTQPQPQPQRQPLARDQSWTTDSSSYPQSSPESLHWDCELSRIVPPPKIAIPDPEPDSDLNNQSNVGTQIEEKTPANQPESVEYVPKSSPDVEISETELMDYWPVSTPETQPDGELMLPNSQYPTRSMSKSNVPAVVQPLSLRDRKSSEIDLSALSPALTVTPPKSSRNTATLLGIGISQQKEKQQQRTATPVPKFAVNVDAEQQQLNEQFAKEQQQKRLNKRVAEQQEQQKHRKLEQERREEEMHKREQERRNEEIQKRDYQNNLRKAEQQQKLVQLRKQMIENKQQEILGRNQRLLQWAQEIQFQQNQLQAVQQQQNQMLLSQQFNQMNLQGGQMNQATQLKLNTLLLTVQNQKIQQQARVQRFREYQAEAIKKQRQQQQIELQL